MGLFEKAIETYDAHASLVGKVVEGHLMLAPISHIVARADLEVTLDAAGKFISARKVGKNESKIPIPVTEQSTARSGKHPPAHPLCDQLSYLAAYDKARHENYVTQLAEWTASAHSHPMLQPILTYVRSETILADLLDSGLIELDGSGIPKNEKLMVCWRVKGFGTPDDGCWQQSSLVQAFQEWYAEKQSGRLPALCMITGAYDIPVPPGQQPKSLHPGNGNAKLISSNDDAGFTYRGRFTEPDQAVTVSYVASQKAHNALRWLIAEQGVRAAYGTRIFLCWNPGGIGVLRVTDPLTGIYGEVVLRPSDYRWELQRTLEGWRSLLPERDGQVVVAALDLTSANTGRLSVTYYNELMGSDFLQRLHDWDQYCCWYFGWDKYLSNAGIRSPKLEQIVTYAYGNPRREKGTIRMDVEDRVLGQQMQRLVACRVDQGHMPLDIVQALVQKASSPQCFSDPKTQNRLWEDILATACAVIQKYRHDIYKEKCLMDLNYEKMDRDALYGCLLALLEKAERDTYKEKETREPNAIRYMSAFCRRPLTVSAQIFEKLNVAYLPKLTPGLRQFYRRKIEDVMSKIQQWNEENGVPESQWNAQLGGMYLVGYSLQRKDLYTKKEKANKNEEEMKNEHSAA